MSTATPMQEHEKERHEAVRLFADCAIGSSEAITRGHFRGYRELLDALGEYGFKYPICLPKEEIERQANLVAHILQNNGCLEMHYGR